MSTCESGQHIYMYLPHLKSVSVKLAVSFPISAPVMLFSSVQFSHSVVSDSLRPHESQHISLPVHNHLPEFIQIHVHRVGDAIPPSHPLSSPSPSVPNPSQHQVFSNESTLRMRWPCTGVSALASFLPKKSQG